MKPLFTFLIALSLLISCKRKDPKPIQNEWIYVTLSDREVHAFNAANGREVWQSATQKSVATNPVVNNGQVSVFNMDGKLIQFDAKTGIRKNEIQLITDYVLNVPGDGFLLAHETLYIGGKYESILAYNIRTGQSKWQLRYGWNSVTEDPVLVGNTLYYAAMSKLYAVNSETGAIRWQVDQLAQHTRKPFYYQGMVYLATSHYPVGKLFAFDAATGIKKWESSEVDTGTTLTAHDGLLFIGSEKTGRFCALDAKTGQIRWNQATPKISVSSNAYYANNLIYVGGFENTLYAFDAQTGTLKWHSTDQGSSAGNFSIVVANGVLYTLGQKLRAINPQNGVELWSSAETPGQFYGVSTLIVTDSNQKNHYSAQSGMQEVQ
ncbi:hypothetical protein BWI97_23530 [Siphonobacter sp. BAB-5405]|uniref:PQQ-binding-like beta-propeller repeat protein n=1 Tax=Siphonobacter sp. BAB-5405 TaxID=1864825 RepID=UPI000C7FA655|nr:PQQ-binding-like beta-propeller repeat protein [Siphonobacter sp. BAB-5405]PMD90450.1 hypothetical protein BWI97_23530 [Siphonobacter sp. BAB-5405]